MECRYCGQRSAQGSRFCEWCGTRLGEPPAASPAPPPPPGIPGGVGSAPSRPSDPAPPPVPPSAPPPVPPPAPPSAPRPGETGLTPCVAADAPPPGWREYRDPWAGLATCLPEAWRVGCLKGQVHVQEDVRVPSGLMLVMVHAGSAAAVVDEAARRQAREVPGFQAWPSGDLGDALAALEFRAGRMGQPVAGFIEARRVAPDLCRLAAWHAPPHLLSSRGPVFRQVVDGCRPMPTLLRSTWIDDTEGAFGLQVPHGWRVQGGVRRQSAALAQSVALVTDPSGTAWVRVGGEAYTFQEVNPMGGWAGLMGGWGAPLMAHPGVEVAPFQPVIPFMQGFLLPRLRSRYPDLAVVRLEERPDLVEAMERAMMQEIAGRVGLEGAVPQASVGEVVLRRAERGVPVVERLGVHTMRIAMPAMMGAPGMWFAEVPAAYGAPQERFAELEPVLAGVADSMQIDPSWQQMQRSAGNSQALASQTDIARRRQEISRTLSETSDIVSSAYHSREAIHQEHAAGRQAREEAGDRSRDWSNAMLGWEDRVDDTGQRWSIPAGHDRVWRDNQGNVLTGNALTNPDPTWHELKPGRS